jgi:hypothetical protein
MFLLSELRGTFSYTENSDNSDSIKNVEIRKYSNFKKLVYSIA